jgi:hypothetical protein
MRLASVRIVAVDDADRVVLNEAGTRARNNACAHVGNHDRRRPRCRARPSRCLVGRGHAAINSTRTHHIGRTMMLAAVPALTLEAAAVAGIGVAAGSCRPLPAEAIASSAALLVFAACSLTAPAPTRGLSRGLRSALESASTRDEAGLAGEWAVRVAAR